MNGKRYTYYESENYKLSVQEVGGRVFLHMNMYNWNKETLRDIQSRAADFFNHYASEGHAVVFATSDNEHTVKFWNLIKPCYIVNKFGLDGEYWIGSWKTQE